MAAIEGIADRMDVHPDGWSVVEEPLQETLKKSARTSLEIFKIFSYLSLLENENNEKKKTNKQETFNQSGSEFFKPPTDYQLSISS